MGYANRTSKNEDDCCKLAWKCFMWKTFLRGRMSSIDFHCVCNAIPMTISFPLRDTRHIYFRGKRVCRALWSAAERKSIEHVISRKQKHLAKLSSFSIVCFARLWGKRKFDTSSFSASDNQRIGSTDTAAVARLKWNANHGKAQVVS